MVRHKELILSGTTLAGLLGFTIYYHSDNIQRLKREADSEHYNSNIDMLAPIEISFKEKAMELERLESSDANPEYDFLKDLGFFEPNADIPEELQEDVQMFQSDGPRKIKSSVPVIMKCMANNACRSRAYATWSKWGYYYKDQIEKHLASLCHPVVSKLHREDDNPNGLGACTPEDNVWPCVGTPEKLDNEGNVISEEINVEDVTYEYYDNDKPWETLTTHPGMIKRISTIESTRLNETINNMNVRRADDKHNVFGNGLPFKVVYIQPNGVPISMYDREDKGKDFKFYWSWFSNFNDRYMGVTKNRAPNRANVHFWFTKQDKNFRKIMPSPAKGSKRFSWDKYRLLFQRIAPTAGLPKIRTTFKQVYSELYSRNMLSSPEEGKDCIIFWFHQYIPEDIIQLAEVSVQENYISKLDEKCIVIHFWVGFENLERDNGNSIQVVKYIQGMFQPSQRLKTAVDPDLRNWFIVPNLEALRPDSAFGQRLAQKVYNNIALDRRRSKCLLAQTTEPIAYTLATFEQQRFDEKMQPSGQSARESQYSYDYYYGNEGYITTTMAGTTLGADETDEESLLKGNEYGDYSYYNFVNETALEVEEKVEVAMDMACCGIGFSGRPYNVLTHECCASGEIHAISDNMCG